MAKGKVFETTFSLAGRVAASFTGSINTANKSLNSLERSTGKTRSDLQSLQSTAQKGVRLETGAAKKNVDDLKDKLKSLESMAKKGFAIAGAGVAAFAGPVKVAMNFEQTMSGVKAVSRATDTEMEKIKQKAKDLGASTAWTTSQVGEGMKMLSVAGFKVEETLDAIGPTLNLASAGTVELAQAADIASNIMTGFGIKAKEMEYVSDVLASTISSSNQNLVMLGESMKYAAPVAKNLGVSFAATAGMTGKLADAGLQGSMAGTALRGIMGRLAGPTKAARKALAQLGIKAKDAKGNLRDLPTIFAEIEKSSKKLGNADKTALFKDIAGDEAYGALFVLAEQAGTGELQKYIASLEEKGRAEEMARELLNNMAGAVTLFKSGVESLALTIGEVLLPYLTEFIQKCTGVMERINQWTKDNKELTAKLVKVAAVAALVTGAIASIALGLFLLKAPIAIITALGKAFLIVGRFFLANPIVLAIGAIVLAIYVLYKNWDRLVSFFKSYIAWIDNLFANNPILNLLNPFIGIPRIIMANWDVIGPYLEGVWDNIKNVVKLGAMLVWSIVKEYTPLGLIVENWEAIITFLTSLGEKLFMIGSLIMTGLIAGIKSQFSFLKDIWDTVNSFIPEFARKKMDVHSPSRVMEEIGGYITQGLGVGIEGGNSYVENAMNGALSIPTATGQSLTGASTNNTSEFNITVNLTGDGDAQQQAQQGVMSAWQEIQQAQQRNARLAY